MILSSIFAILSSSTEHDDKKEEIRYEHFKNEKKILMLAALLTGAMSFNGGNSIVSSATSSRASER